MLLKIKAEILFLLITFVVTILVMYPLYTEYGNKYMFYFCNISFIVIFITLTRYIFLLRYTPFSHNKWIKVILLFACIPVFLYLIDGIYEFQRFVDEEGFHTLSIDQNSQHTQNVAKYTRYQYLFFGAGCLVTLILVPLRMIVSLWQQINKGTI